MTELIYLLIFDRSLFFFFFYFRQATSLESTPVDLAVGKKNLNLALVAINDAVVVLRDGRIANVHKVKFQPSAIALSIDETKVAVGGKDNLIRMFNLSGDNLSETGVLKGHKGPITSIAFNPDGAHAASADQNREIIVWDLAKNEAKIQGWVFHNARVNSVAWSPSGKHLVSGSLDSHLYVWSVADPMKKIHIRGAHQGGVNSVLWIDDNTVASAGQDCCIKTWKITHH